MWVKTNFGGALVNSLYVSITATLIALVLSIPAAYAMSRYRFAGKGAYRTFLLMTQMMSPIVLVLGLFRLMAAMGLVDSLNSLVITYAAFNMAFTIWMLQSYFNSIPRDLEEAAWMDGASHFTSLVKVFLPLAVPAMVVTAIFTFINSWNEFVLALTMLRSSEQFTLPGPDLLPGRRALSGRMAPRHGGHRARHRPSRHRVLLAPALPDPRHGARRREIGPPHGPRHHPQHPED
jgi:multiple sugar transport system permease protein